MGTESLISVIVPVYKVEKYLPKCIDSILNQTYRNLEIILVDDRSPDNCPQICDEYAKRDSRIVVIHKENGGLSDARNAGIEIAKGDYIGFVDSDDYIHPQMYEKLLVALESNHADLAICSYEYVNEAGESIPNDSPVKSEILSGYEGLEKLNIPGWWYYVTAWNRLYTKELFSRIRFPKGKINEDEFIAHEILDSCKKIATIGDKLYIYVQRTGSIMSDKKSVKNLDNIEAFYNRISYYDCKGYSALLSGLVQVWFLQYVLLRGIVTANNKAERHRIKEIDSMMLETHQLAVRHIPLKRQILLHFPDIVFAGLRLKRKLRIRSRLSFAKSLLKYTISGRKNSVVLLDTPTHGNLGDHAIVLAEQQLLEERGITYTELTASEINNREHWYARCTPMNRYIVVHGGGFLGALWPDEEFRFRRILQAFSKHKVVVFPQTVTFDMDTPEGRAFFEESKAVYSAHPNLTIFVREKKSYEFMREFLPEVNVCLVPDIVTILKTEQKSLDRSGVLLCMRADLEKKISDDEMSVMLKAIADRYPNERIEKTDTVVDHRILPDQRKAEVGAKLQQFSGVKLVITDRLHGMVFAALTNTPCIALGNSNGKVKGVFKWLSSNQYIKYIDSVDKFDEALHSLDLIKQYQYDVQSVIHEFEPLVKILSK